MTARYSDIADNVKRVREDIARAATACGRSPDEIQMMAVTKGHPAQIINRAVEAGVRLLGESRAQELAARYGEYTPGCDIHFIGHLQSNKVRQIIGRVALIESVDRLSLAREINRCAAARSRAMPVLVEVNIGQEPAKSGVAPAQLGEFLLMLRELPHLSVAGLMAIVPNVAPAVREGYFMQMYGLFLDIRSKKMDNVNMDILSMGMSDDYALAVRHGSTIVRIGRAIFGERL